MDRIAFESTRGKKEFDQRTTSMHLEYQWWVMDSLDWLNLMTIDWIPRKNFDYLNADIDVSIDLVFLLGVSFYSRYDGKWMINCVVSQMAAVVTGEEKMILIAFDHCYSLSKFVMISSLLTMTSFQKWNRLSIENSRLKICTKKENGLHLKANVARIFDHGAKYDWKTLNDEEEEESFFSPPDRDDDDDDDDDRATRKKEAGMEQSLDE